MRVISPFSQVEAGVKSARYCADRAVNGETPSQEGFVPLSWDGLNLSSCTEARQASSTPVAKARQDESFP